MEIDGTNTTRILDTQGIRPEAQQAQRKTAEPETGQSGDVVSISQDARLLTAARTTLENTPDVRAEKVESLRIQVANGTYKPDSRTIAANLIREEPQLFRL